MLTRVYNFASLGPLAMETSLPGSFYSVINLVMSLGLDFQSAPPIYISTQLNLLKPPPLPRTRALSLSLSLLATSHFSVFLFLVFVSFFDRVREIEIGEDEEVYE